jgi:hypothetical protein
MNQMAMTPTKNPIQQATQKRETEKLHTHNKDLKVLIVTTQQHCTPLSGPQSSGHTLIPEKERESLKHPTLMDPDLSIHQTLNISERPEKGVATRSEQAPKTLPRVDNKDDLLRKPRCRMDQVRATYISL